MGLMTKIFGTYSERELKQIYPVVDKPRRRDTVRLRPRRGIVRLRRRDRTTR
ncbi:MAG: hypothetical protein HFF77_10330 [Oscillospiraceae bacterium]|nr:hypothetical protein [Oscillospiraceae bacterium]